MIEIIPIADVNPPPVNGAGGIDLRGDAITAGGITYIQKADRITVTSYPHQHS